MAEIEGRQLHLVKKALATTALAIEQQDGALKSASDQADMKALLAELISSEAELEHYLRAARIVVLGRAD